MNSFISRIGGKCLDVLSNIKGKFVLSYNDCDFIRELYKNFKIIEVSRNNNLNPKLYHKPYFELIIKTF
ncbi:hypothetical protein FACS1894132_05860 [Clostridia bacterium]|nr:hypothetical protein FACS1894132_05860 [Clostridia bacterium]